MWIILFAAFQIFSAAPALAEESGAKAACNMLYGKIMEHKEILAGGDSSQIERIEKVLNSMSSEDRTKLYATLAKEDLPALARNIRSGKIEGFEKLYQEQPNLANLMVDFVEFGDTFPGIFASVDPDNAVSRVLKLVREQETAVKISNPEVLKSQAEAPRLRRTLDNSLINLIEQADAEYSGMRFGRSRMSAFLYRLKRFFLPSYKRVNALVNWTEENQKQLQRLKKIDAIIIKYGLSEAKTLGLTDAEINTLLKYVLNSPDEIRDIEKATQKVFGEQFKTGKEVEIGKFDIYGAYKNMNKLDSEKLYDSFDKVNVESLDKMNETLNAARGRKGELPRMPKDYENYEVQVRYESAERQMVRTHEQYGAYTSERSNVSYTVERRHERTKQVYDGTDEKGNAKYRTEVEVYYTDDTVTPSFENILSGSYDTGDRSVTGLSTVKRDAAAMVEREAGPRALFHEAEDLANHLSSNWHEVLRKGEIAKEKEKVDDLLRRVTAAVESQSQYENLSQNQILGQYRYDNPKNFEQRNAWMRRKLIENRNALTMISESMRRQVPEIYPSFDLMNYEHWLDNLRHQRNKARTIQAGMGATAVGAAGVATVNADDDGHRYLEDHGIHLNDWMDQSFDYVQQFMPGAEERAEKKRIEEKYRYPRNSNYYRDSDYYRYSR